MGILDVRESKGMRLTAAITLVTMLSGCVAPGLGGQQGNGQSSNGGGFGGMGGLGGLGSLESLNQKFGGALATAGGLSDKLSAVAGKVGLPGGKPGLDHREWTQADQNKALEVKAFFDGKASSGKASDGLPEYDPTRPGEKERYTREINRVVSKYKGRTELTQTEMLEVANAILPVLRFIANSRAYRLAKAEAQASKGSSPAINTRGKSVASLEVPPMATIELVASFYCNDRNLPAPWRGLPLSPKPTANYMPAELLPIYKDVHRYAATNQRGHYGTQGIVWWLRHNPCAPDRLSNDARQHLEAASPGATSKLQTYCLKDKVKQELLSRAGGFLPTGSGQIAEYQNMLGYLQDTQQKAAVVLGADLSNPADLMNLVKTAGFQVKPGKDSLLQNEALRSVLPVLQKSGVIESMIPRNMDERATEATMSVLQQLGDEMGRQYGDTSTSVANHAELPNGLYIKVDGNKITLHNPTPQTKTFENTDVVLSNVDDSDFTGKEGRSPITQRYSLGPLVPTGIKPAPNEDHRKNLENERDALSMLDPLKKMDGNIKVKPHGTEGTEAKETYDCPSDENTGREYRISLADESFGLIGDVIEGIPFVGNLLTGVSAATGRHWMTGKPLDKGERGVNALAAVAVGANSAKAVLKVGARGVRLWKKLSAKVRGVPMPAPLTAAELAAQDAALGKVARGYDVVMQVAKPGADSLNEMNKFFNGGDRCGLAKGLIKGGAPATCAIYGESSKQCKIAKGVELYVPTVHSMAERAVAGYSQDGSIMHIGFDYMEERGTDEKGSTWGIIPNTTKILPDSVRNMIMGL